MRTPPRSSVILAFLLSALAGAGHARAEDFGCECLAHRLERAGLAAPGEGRGGAFDPATGRDHRNYPPDPLVEFRAMSLSLRFEDMTDGAFTGTQRLTVAPIGVPVPALRLAAEGLRIASVTVDGKAAEFSHDGHDLAIRFAAPLGRPADGAKVPESRIEIAYSGFRPVAGLTFSPPTPELPGVAPARAPEVHTQGETETNSHWFPIHDFPNVRLPTELEVDVPAGFQVSSNGRLVSHGIADGRETWHWRQEKSHVPYLVTLVVGQFDRVELPSQRSGVPMAVWAPKGRGADAEATYERTDRMVALFERVFGAKYPWARYDQLIVRNFGAGGMENTSATTMQPSAVMDDVARAEGDLDGLISHELCHQWTGDLVTCRSWEHIWLNEGWATYGTALWMEERDGPDGYWDSVLGNAGVARGDVATAPEPMCSPVYASAGETFRRPANPYPKGASILHMLRRMLGDEAFFRGVRAYMASRQLGLAETDDFRRAMEEASGLGLEWFFDQWCFRPGSPQVKAKLSYDAATRTLSMEAQQSQQVDARTPAMRISLPVWVRTASGERTIPFEMRDRSGTVSAVLDGPPVAAWVDPWLEALKTIEVDQPQEWTAEAMRSAPTHAARRQALAGLARTETPEARAALVGAARSDALRHTMRIDAIEAIARWESPEAKAAVADLARAAFADPRVRAAAVSALSKASAADAVPTCRAILEPPQGTAAERSYAVRAAAIDVLRAHGAKECLDVVRRQVSVPSHNEAISQAAVRFLAKHGDASDAAALQGRAALGIQDRARPTAIEGLADLAPRLDAEGRASAERFLLALVEDPEDRSANAACSALAELRCKAALPRLQAIAEHDRDPGRRRRAEGWVKRINEAK